MSFPVMRRAAFALAAGLFAFGAGVAGAAAQTATKPAAEAPKPAGEAPKPAEAPKAGEAAKPQGPVKLDLFAVQPQWTKLCGKDNGSGREVCLTTRDFGISAEQPPIGFALYQMANEDKRNLRVILPLGMLLKPGFRIVIDKGEPIDGKYALCLPNGCFGEAEVNGAGMTALKKATTVSVVVRNPVNLEITFNIPMKDFATAFDGPAADPKVIEQQNQELQKQLEEKAKKQRELLEQQNGAATPKVDAPKTDAPKTDAPAAPAK